MRGTPATLKNNMNVLVFAFFEGFKCERMKNKDMHTFLCKSPRSSNYNPTEMVPHNDLGLESTGVDAW